MSFKIPLSLNLGFGLSSNTPLDRRQSPAIITVFSSKIGYKFLDNTLNVSLGGNYVIAFKGKNEFWDSEEELTTDENGNEKFDIGSTDNFIDKNELDNNKLTLKSGVQYKFPKQNITVAFNLDYSQAKNNLIVEQDDPAFKAKLAVKFGF